MHLNIDSNNLKLISFVAYYIVREYSLTIIVYIRVIYLIKS